MRKHWTCCQLVVSKVLRGAVPPRAAGSAQVVLSVCAGPAFWKTLVGSFGRGTCPGEGAVWAYDPSASRRMGRWARTVVGTRGEQNGGRRDRLWISLPPREV